MSRVQGVGSKLVSGTNRAPETSESPIAIPAMPAIGASSSTSNNRKRRRSGRAPAQTAQQSHSHSPSQAQSQSHANPASSQLQSPPTRGKQHPEAASSTNALQPLKHAVVEVGSSSPESISRSPSGSKRQRKRASKRQKNAHSSEGTAITPIEILDGDSMNVGSSAERYETASEMDPSSHLSNLSIPSVVPEEASRRKKGKSKACSADPRPASPVTAQIQAGPSFRDRARTPMHTGPLKTLGKTLGDDTEQDVEKLKAQLESYKQVILTQSETLQAINGECTCHVCTESVWRPFVLVPCGHMFCLACLIAWFQRLGEGEEPLPVGTTEAARSWNEHEAARRTLRRSKVCPECRTTLTEPPVELWSVKMVMDKMHEGASKLASLAKESGSQELKAILPREIGLFPPEETVAQRDTRLGLSLRLIKAHQVVADKRLGLWHDIFPKRKTRGNYPKWDGDDAVYRCPDCASEIEDLFCEACGYEVIDFDEWSDREDFEHRRDEIADLTWAEMHAFENRMLGLISGEEFSADDFSDADSDGNLEGFIDDRPPQSVSLAGREGVRRRPRRLVESDEEEEDEGPSFRHVVPRSGDAPAQPIYVDVDSMDDFDVDINSAVDDSETQNGDDEEEEEDDFIHGPRRAAWGLVTIDDDDDDDDDDDSELTADMDVDTNHDRPDAHDQYPTTDEGDDEHLPWEYAL